MSEILDGTFDPEADAVYLRLSRHPISRAQELAPGIIADFDAEGRFVGLEVLEAGRLFARDFLAALTRP